MVAEAGMFVASVVLLGCLALAVMNIALVDYGPASADCPAVTKGDDRGTARWSTTPPGITCTYGKGTTATTVYHHRWVPAALAGAVAAAVALVLLRRVSLRIQSRSFHERNPVYAEELMAELEARRRHAGI